MRQPLRALCAATALGLSLTVLAGCSDDPEPNIGGDDPSSEAAPPESSEPATTEPATDGTEATEPTEPTEPPSSEVPEGETAEDFIRRWAAVEKDMQNTGETAAYRELSPGCSGCDELADAIEGYYSAGGDVEWRGWAIRKIRVYDKSRSEYLVTVDAAPTKYRERSGGPVKRLAGGRVDWILQLAPGGDSWLVTEKAFLSE